MANITLKGNPIHTVGALPAVGSTAPDFKLVGASLGELSLADFRGMKKVLNIFPSLDTGTCAQSVRTFNQRAAGLDGVKVLCVSADLPFAHARFCVAEGIDNVVTGSTFRGSFLDDYGVRIVDGPLAGLAARSVVVVDGDDKVVYTQLVPEIVEEPDYDAALAAL